MIEKWTPGPWDVSGEVSARYLSGIGDVRLIRRVTETDNRYIALASIDAMGFPSDPVIRTTPQERDANAQLIATAPALYAALKAIVNSTDYGADDDRPLMRAARAALEAATIVS